VKLAILLLLNCSEAPGVTHDLRNGSWDKALPAGAFVFIGIAMKIVHVVRQFHPAVGGLEYVVLEIVKSQIARGHIVKVVTLDRIFNATVQPTLPSRDAVAGAEVIRIPFFGSTRYPFAPSVIRHITDADIVHVHAIDFSSIISPGRSRSTVGPWSSPRMAGISTHPSLEC
jgi:hypothetical protein